MNRLVQTRSMRDDIHNAKRNIPDCPLCKVRGGPVLRCGGRATKRGRIQRYFCQHCGKYFTEALLPGMQHDPRLMLEALTLYNIGHSLQGVSDIIRTNHHKTVPASTISSWKTRMASELPFLPLRERFNLDPKISIVRKRFDHGQVYEFAYHALKTNIAGKQFPSLATFIKRVPKATDDELFRNGARCSSTKLWSSISSRIQQKTTLTHLCGLALELAKNNNGRHMAVQQFLLVNDSKTIAVEVPLAVKDARGIIPGWGEGGLSGHIDLIQTKGGKVRVLDYKPAPVDDRGAQNQLTLYAMLLSKLSGIPLYEFVCVYFNDVEEKSFFPLYIINNDNNHS